LAEGNGTPVTWRELNLVVDPIKDDVKEIKEDVKRLVRGQATAAGIELVAKEDRDDRRAWLPPLMAALVAGLISVPAYIFHL
jgi:hypothetical protein